MIKYYEVDFSFGVVDVGQTWIKVEKFSERLDFPFAGPLFIELGADATQGYAESIYALFSAYVRVMRLESE